MDLDELQRNWEEFGRTDPMWAVLTESDKRGGKWDEEEFFANGRALVDAIIKQLQPFGLPRGRQAALDFGCGVGRLTQAACQHFDRVIGVDIAASMIAAANNYNRFGVRCEYLHNTRPDLTAIADDSIDFVLTLLVLQHMREHAIPPSHVKNVALLVKRWQGQGGDEPLSEQLRSVSFRSK